MKISLLEKIDDFLMAYSLKNSSLLVGVSGGVDSMVLLHGLLELSEENGLSLEIAHLNHGLRGESADEDAEFVRRHAGKLGLKATIERRNVKKYQDNSISSIEEAARKIRFEYLSEVAAENGMDYIALGHNKDDQAETILMHIIRGAGLRGLAGMHEKRGKYIRPLLDVSSGEVEEFAEERGIPHRIDKTNKDQSFTRNRLRHDLIPKIQNDYNPRVVDNLARMGHLVREARGVLEDKVDKIWSELSLSPPKNNCACFHWEELLTHRSYLQKMLLRKGIALAKENLRDISATHVHSILEALGDNPTRITLDLPGVTFVLRRQKACFYRDYQEPATESFKYEIEPPGSFELEEYRVRLDFDLVTSEEAPDLSTVAGDRFTEIVNWNKVEPPIIVKNRDPGDSFYPLGMQGSKKIKDFFVDLKVPVKERNRIPLILDQRHVIWVVGYRIDDRYKVDEATDRVLIMKARALC